MDELIQIFAEEAEELLANLEQITLRLEEDPQDAEALNDLFRTAHTLKGAASLAGVKEVADVTHLLESALEEVCQGVRPFDRNLADTLFGGFDFVREAVGQIREGIRPSPQRLETVLAALRESLLPTAKPEATTTLAAAAPDREALRRLKSPARWKILRLLGEGNGVWQVRLSFPPDMLAAGQDPLTLLKEMLAFGTPEHVETYGETLPPLKELRPEGVYLAFDLYLSQVGEKDLGEACARFAPSLAMSRASRLSCEDFLLPLEPVSLKEPALATQIEALLADSADLNLLAFRLDELADAAADRRLESLLRNCSLLFYVAGTRPGQATVRDDLLKLLKEMVRALREGEVFDLDPSLLLADLLSAPGGGALPEQDGERPCNAGASEQQGRPAPPGGKGARPRSDLRIPAERVDHLFDLAGELVVAKNSLPYLIRKLEVTWGIPEAARELKERYLLLDRVARELQDIVLGLKLVPFRQLFSRFPRYVRDMSRKLGKEVRLITEGEETGCDKDVMEALYEPLLHLVRNSLDHGLETPAEREAVAKERVGRLWLRAGQEGDRLFVEVEDDGRGINPDLVRAKAVAQGILEQSQAASLTDDEAVRLIFHPHFSTAERVTELSGRGVGMDVVREALEKLGGHVEINNAPGRGLAVRLFLPITLATTRVLLFEVCGRRFGIALNAVREAVRVAPHEIRTMKGDEIIVVRGEVMPLLRLSTVLGLGDDYGEYLRVVLLKGGVGISVTRLLGEEDVVLKALPPEAAATGLYQAAAVLADGSVLLVLDAQGLTKEAFRGGSLGALR